MKQALKPRIILLMMIFSCLALTSYNSSRATYASTVTSRCKTIHSLAGGG